MLLGMMVVRLEDWTWSRSGSDCIYGCELECEDGDDGLAVFTVYIEWKGFYPVAFVGA